MVKMYFLWILNQWLVVISMILLQSKILLLKIFNRTYSWKQKFIEAKEQLHKSRKNNGILRSKITKHEKETEELRDNKVELLYKIEKLEKGREKDREYIKQQENEIQMLQTKLRKSQDKANNSDDIEKEQLRANLDRVVNVKLKYENLIKALVDRPELKPIIASILDQ